MSRDTFNTLNCRTYYSQFIIKTVKLLDLAALSYRIILIVVNVLLALTSDHRETSDQASDQESGPQCFQTRQWC